MCYGERAAWYGPCREAYHGLVEGLRERSDLPGDTTVDKSRYLLKFINAHIEKDNCCSFELRPSGPDRLRQGRKGRTFGRIVEHKDATPDERKCREVNSGMYVFKTSALSAVIDRLSCANSQKEYYLPDAVALTEQDGGRTDAVKAQDAAEFLGINDPGQLAEAASVMKKRILDKWMNRGVRCNDPASTWIGPKVELGEDIEIKPNVQLWGRTSIGNGCTVGSFTILTDSVLEDNVEIVGNVMIKKSRVGERSTVGPFVYIRDGAEIHDDVHVGRFVEIEKHDSERARSHTSYVGDADIGERPIRSRYDNLQLRRRKKNFTKIGNNCFVGSDTMFVAPVTVEDNVVTAAGSVITQDIPDGALGVARARQKISRAGVPAGRSAGRKLTCLQV